MIPAAATAIGDSNDVTNMSMIEDRVPATEEKEDIEEKKVGRIQTKVFFRYLQSVGFTISAVTLLSIILMQITINGMAYWLAYWVSHQNQFTTSSFIIISLIIVIVNTIFTLIRSFIFAYGTLQASKQLYSNLVRSIMLSSLAFFEANSVGRIVNRIGRDIYSVDDQLPFMLNILLAQAFLLLGSAIIIMYTDPLIIAVFVGVFYTYYRLQRFYRSSSRELRRLDSIYRSPIYSILSDCVMDSVSIRSMKQLDFYEKAFEVALNNSLQISRIISLSSQWLNIRLQLMGALVAACLALSSVLCASYSILPVSAALLGLSLSYSLTLVSNLNGLIGSITETEKEMISVERILEYIDLPTEDRLMDEKYDRMHGPVDNKIASDDRFGSQDHPQRTTLCNFVKALTRPNRKLYVPLMSDEIVSRNPISTCMSTEHKNNIWITSGDIAMKGVVMTYDRCSVPALRGITVRIEAGSRVAIVGRTGSGKSSLIRVLLHLNAYEGSVMLSGLDIKGMGRYALRSSIGVIPQDPVLFTSSLRFNLDPMGQYSDEELLRVIDVVGLKNSLLSSSATTIDEMSYTPMNVMRKESFDSNERISVTSVNGERERIADILALMVDGGHLSQGQKQLICLARVLLKPYRLILIDEATSSIDPFTESILYNVLKAKSIENNATVLCICHKFVGAKVLCNYKMEMSDGEMVSYEKI